MLAHPHLSHYALSLTIHFIHIRNTNRHNSTSPTNSPHSTTIHPFSATRLTPAFHQALALCAAAVRGSVAGHTLATLSVGDHMYSDGGQAGGLGSVMSYEVGGGGGLSAMSFPSFESSGGGGYEPELRGGDVVGQLPHLLALFSFVPSAVEVQGLLGNGLARAASLGTAIARNNVHHHQTTSSHSNNRDHPLDDGVDAHTYAQGPGLDWPDGGDLTLVLSRPWFTDPLHEPHLPWVASEIGLCASINSLHHPPLPHPCIRTSPIIM